MLQEMRLCNWGLGVHLYYPKICETKTKSYDFYFQFALVEKWYAEWSETGQFLNYEK